MVAFAAGAQFSVWLPPVEVPNLTALPFDADALVIVVAGDVTLPVSDSNDAVGVAALLIYTAVIPIAPNISALATSIPVREDRTFNIAWTNFLPLCLVHFTILVHDA